MSTKKNKVRIIAEAGVNHNGSIKNIYKLIDIASSSNSDFVKFQITNSKLISKHAPKAKYQKKNTNINETQKSMISKLEFDWNILHPKLVNYCSKKNIKFLTSAFDEIALDQIKKLKLGLYKIPSGEITNLTYLEHLSRFKGEILLSTGMSNLKEIERALKVLTRFRNNKITLLHCNSAYPTPFIDANLKAIVTLKKEFGYQVGYSDHTLGIEAAVAAVALGATVIEKHFTIRKDMKGPDHKASLEPKELKKLVEAIRNIEIGMGNGFKKVTKSEKENRDIARKSIIAKTKILKGDKFSPKNITFKRPGIGLSPFKYYDVLGKISRFDFEEDDLIKL